jgi:hypothetical protein
VAELDRGLHLATLDQVGVGLENRIHLLVVGSLLAAEYAAASLMDHLASHVAKVLDPLARLGDHQLGWKRFGPISVLIEVADVSF